MFNVTQGNTARFIVEFISSLGVQQTPSSAQVVVTYSVAGSATTGTVALTLDSGFWAGNWDSTPADLGIASWLASSPLSPSPAATGLLNIIDP